MCIHMRMHAHACACVCTSYVHAYIQSYAYILYDRHLYSIQYSTIAICTRFNEYIALSILSTKIVILSPSILDSMNK